MCCNCSISSLWSPLSLVLFSQKTPQPYFCANPGKRCSWGTLQRLGVQLGALQRLAAVCVVPRWKERLRSSGGQLLSFTPCPLASWVPSWCCGEVFGQSPQHSCSQCLECDTKGQVCTRGEILWLCTAVIVCDGGQLWCNYLAVWFFSLHSLLIFDPCVLFPRSSHSTYILV